MARAWPFEGRAEPEERPRTPREFVRRGARGAEAVVVRIGMNDAQLVLVDGAGRWDRWVYHSVDEATAAAADLGVPVHTGHYPEELRVRMNAYRRPPEDLDRAAYPEQGRVGPVIPYRENRPRSADQLPEEAPPRRPS